MARTMHMLNCLGHVTLRWEEPNDDKILPAIETMLAQGFKFFILANNQERDSVLDVVTTSREVIIPDETLQLLYDEGLLQAGGVTVEEDAETTGELARTAEEVAAQDTVVTQPASGG